MPQAPGEPLEGLLEALARPDPRLPAQDLSGPSDVRAAPLRVVLGERLVDDLAPSAGEPYHQLGDLAHRVLYGVAYVDRAPLLAPRQPQDALHEVVDVLDAPGLRSVAVDG